MNIEKEEESDNEPEKLTEKTEKSKKVKDKMRKKEDK